MTINTDLQRIDDAVENKSRMSPFKSQEIFNVNKTKNKKRARPSTVDAKARIFSSASRTRRAQSKENSDSKERTCEWTSLLPDQIKAMLQVKTRNLTKSLSKERKIKRQRTTKPLCINFKYTQANMIERLLKVRNIDVDELRKYKTLTSRFIRN